MPYQPAVTPDFSPLERGITAFGAGIAQRHDNIRKERERNEAADVTLEHLHSASPELLESFLRRGGDTETASADLLSKFLGNSTRAKKEALIGAAAGHAMMTQRKLEQGLEVTRVGNDGARIAQNQQQFDAEQKRLKTGTAIQAQQQIADRRAQAERQKAQAQITVTQMPGGGVLTANGAGNFSFGAGRETGAAAPPAWAVEAMKGDPQLYWSGDSLKSKALDPAAAYNQMNGGPGVQTPGLPPIPAPSKYASPDAVKADPRLSREQKAQILRTDFGFR